MIAAHVGGTHIAGPRRTLSFGLAGADASLFQRVSCARHASVDGMPRAPAAVVRRIAGAETGVLSGSEGSDT